MIVDPQQYASCSTLDLTRAAARGEVGVDHRLIRVLLDRGEAIFPDLARFLETESASAPIGLEPFLVDVARAARTPAALPFLAQNARVRNLNLNDELTGAFLELGPAAVDTLLQLHEERPDARDVCFALAALRVPDPRILEILVSELHESPADGALDLGLYGDPAALPALEKALASAGDDEKLRIDLETAIAECRAERAPEPPPAFDIWQEYPAEEAPDFTLLDPEDFLAFLGSPVPEYRSRAIHVLAIDPLTPPARRRIFEIAQNDPDAGVRAEAWEALEDAGDDRAIMNALRRKADDESAPPVERAGALVALARPAADDERFRRKILELYEIPETRVRAIKAMWRSTDRRFTDYAVRHLEDPNLDIRREAIAAAGWLGAVSQVGRLEKLFQDDDVRDSALLAYALAAPGEVTPSRARRLFDRIEGLAGGLSREESTIVMKTLDTRLHLRGYDPVFLLDEKHEDEAAARTQPAKSEKIRRNQPCPCGSGKKYKKCCGASGHPA